ncbi:hypothetical protein [Zavarzinella formosa]|uniref:hypothetical protein n=1 Tax=Zavarzinella formosa TaxID=360055 RepID=UPI0002E4E09E|nr:hypothetical protein [Zavarzinella formosa]
MNPVEDESDDLEGFTEEELQNWEATVAAALRHHAGRTPILRELFSKPITGNGVMGDSLIGDDDETDEEKPD